VLLADFAVRLELLNCMVPWAIVAGLVSVKLETEVAWPLSFFFAALGVSSKPQ